jgi:hypothetical protein
MGRRCNGTGAFSNRRKGICVQDLQTTVQARWIRGTCASEVRDFDPNLDSIRKEPKFKAVFADIERDMARQRAQLVARAKDAPPDLAAVH